MAASIRLALTLTEYPFCAQLSDTTAPPAGHHFEWD